jgi:hypothetical protein
MPQTAQIGPLLSGMVADLLKNYDERVPERGMFPDVRVMRPFHFGDPETTLPGKVELVVMNMDREMDPQFSELRFVSVRVVRSRHGGFASMSCLHSTKGQLRARLEELQRDPEFLVERVEELAEGLPEETNPDIWR